MGFKAGVSNDQRAAETQIDEEMLALVTQLTNEINWCLHVLTTRPVTSGRCGSRVFSLS
jgi:hypothetical protein